MEPSPASQAEVDALFTRPPLMWPLRIVGASLLLAGVAFTALFVRRAYAHDLTPLDGFVFMVGLPIAGSVVAMLPGVMGRFPANTPFSARFWLPVLIATPVVVVGNVSVAVFALFANFRL